MLRKILVVLAALVFPGGLIALFVAWVLKALVQSERGRQVLSLAQKRVLPAWASSWALPAQHRQAA